MSRKNHTVADWSIRQFWHNNFTSFLVNLLLDPIGMLIPWLKKSWITTPNLSLNYPKLRVRRRVGLFNLSLGCFGFCNPRLFKSWDYLIIVFFLKFRTHTKIFDPNLFVFLFLNNVIIIIYFQCSNLRPPGSSGWVFYQWFWKIQNQNFWAGS